MKPLNYKLLIKSAGFMFLPTLSILAIIWVGFWDTTRFTNFMTSTSGWGGVVRIGMIAIEVAFVVFIYSSLVKEQEEKDQLAKIRSRHGLSEDSELDYKFTHTNDSTYESNNYERFARTLSHTYNIFEKKGSMLEVSSIGDFILIKNIQNESN